MKRILLAVTLVLTTTLSFAQVLGIYEFTGNNCPTPAVHGVTAQPANAVFSDYGSANVNCNPGADIFNTRDWNVTATLDLTEYNAFTITPDACYGMTLSSLSFVHRASSISTAPMYYVRSSVDNYASDLATGAIPSSNQTATVTLPAGSFTNLTSAVTFRIYVTSMPATTTTYRHDNVQLNGTVAATGVTSTWYIDTDTDGFGDPAVSTVSCAAPAGYVADNTDCDDSNPAVNPSTVWYEDNDADGLGNPAVSQTACLQPAGYVANDNDCDDSDNAVGAATTTYYQDLDNDGFGNAAVTQVACTQPAGFAPNDDDCDDNDNAVGVASTVYYLDNDNDTYGDGGSTVIACTQPAGYVSNGDDCDDNNSAIHPGATETCDGVDNDCFGGIDDNVVTLTWYEDLDNDGLGNAAVTQDNCAQPAGYVANDDDCDDNDNTVGAATTTYYQDLDTDGFGNAAVTQVACTQPAGYVSNDDDCDDSDNTLGAAQTWYADTDNDTYGDAFVSQVACTAPAGYVGNAGDCNDADNTIHPGATEIPDNGIDEDCVGGDLNTLGSTLATYTFTGNDCTVPTLVLGVDAQPANTSFSDYGTANSDCAPGVNYFNRTNWNMASTIDLAEYNEFTITPDNCYELHLTQLSFLHRVSGSAGTPFVYVRSSLDNFASDVFSVQIMTTGVNITETITLPAAFANIAGPVTFRFYVAGMANAGATYRQDNVTVAGFPATAIPTQTYYADADNDGFGDPAASVTDCVQPAGYVTDNTDCNDNHADEFPGATWYQDSDNDGFGNSAVSLTQCTQPAGYVTNDSDCDDSDNAIGSPAIFYADADSDGFGDAGSTQAACTQPAGYVTNSDDCDDNDNTVGIASTEVFEDNDNDGFGDPSTSMIACGVSPGYVANGDDCDDTDNTVGIAATEVFEDTDGDGFGDPNSSMIACGVPAGYVLDNTDCDDTDEDINPNATDMVGDGIDDNCDGTDGNLGIDELDNAAVTVFPNPGTTAVTISLAGNWSETEIVLLSVDGKTIQTLKSAVVNGTATISTEHLQPSVYFIRVTDGSRKAMVRWVKQ